jgi:phosphatidate cytidylyltransferase
VLTRIVTAVLAGSVALAAILWREPWGIITLALVVIALGGLELSLMTGVALYALSPFLLLPAFLVFWPEDGVPITSMVTPTVLPWLLGGLSLSIWKPNKLLYVFGLGLWLLVGVLSLVLLQIQAPPGSGSFSANLLCLALLPLWVGDSLAYFVGKAVGKHKMAPSISPNKTWEGAIANLLGCLGAAYGIGAWLGVPVVASLAVGLTTGVLGQVGDLLQSRLKRLANVKDSGSILPGHGGILDRLDSFLFSSYPSLLALYLLAPEAFHVKQWPW